jgi:peptidoglycan/LPS O-acetylase OafA/YrhL
VQGAEGTRSETFRPDLEGLRGLAILLVLAFHASVPGITGGYIGVDVFFVLSGFLITGLLIRERERTGRIDLPAFYARRARRILPAAAVVILLTLPFAWVVMAPLDLPRVAGDAMAAALSAANMRFAATSMDYFSQGGSPSPYLHYWSLGVEEQFYLVWPALLIVATRLGKPRLSAGVVLTLVTIVSFAGAVWLTDWAAPWAFYSLPTRAWQLGLGGLLAVGAGSGARAAAWLTASRRRRLRIAVWRSRRLGLPRLGRRIAHASLVVIGWAGLAAIVASAFVLDADTPYPGLAALLPTLGGAALILSGTRRFSPGHVLVLAPMRWLGRISFSLYLVHWPILILPAALLPPGQTLTLASSLALAGVSIAVAAGLHYAIEEPFHRGARFQLPTGRILEAAGVSIASLVLLTAGLGTAASGLLDAGSSAPISASVAGGSDATSTTSPDDSALAGITGITGEGPVDTTPPSATSAPPTVGPTATTAPTTAATPTPTAKPAPALKAPKGPIPLPANVRPSLANASNDWERLLHDGCLIQELQVVPANCVYGDPNGTITVALVGDSHASQWFPAVQRLALAKHWKLVPFVKLSCRFVDLPIYSRVLKREYTECEQWRPLVIKRLQALKPDLTIVAAAEGMEPMTAADNSPAVQGTAMARLLKQIPGPKAIIVDTPAPMFDVPVCLSAHISDVTQCATPRATAYTWRHRTLEVTATKATPHTTLVDLSTAICPYDPCPAVYNGMIVYRDVFHLTATFAAYLAPQLAAALPAIGPVAAPKPTPTATPTAPLSAPIDPRDRPRPV